jgi:hypothetical protein
VAGSVTGRSTSAAARSTDHAVYVSHALDGPHDLLLEDLTVDGRNGLATAIVFYHSEGGNLNAWNVTVRRLRVLGTQQGVVLADRTLRNITVDGATISGVLAAAVNFEAAGATGILLSNNTTIDSGSGVGFYSSLGPSPAGVTFHNNSFD